jgi:hypothetical protein
VKVRALLLLAATLGVLPSNSRAEPYLAVQMGFKCLQCHANPTGGGLRNAYGNAFAQTQLAARRLDPADSEPWTGILDRRLAIGGNLRTGYSVLDVPGEQSENEFDVEEARIFADVAVIPGRLSLYIDERIAPGTAENLEAQVRFWIRENGLYVKAGRMYLPFGWRLEDDSSFVRQASGIGMTTPDTGLEIGLETGSFSAQLAVSNGTAGGPEVDAGKQVTLRTEYVRPVWRAGLSASSNDSDAGARHVFAVHAALRTGPVAWLGEVNYIDDSSLAPSGRNLIAAFAEANWRVTAGHNLKLTFDYFDPDEDVDEDQQNRASLVYEVTPVEFLQLRLGARVYDGIPQNDAQNRREYFLQLHGFF